MQGFPDGVKNAIHRLAMVSTIGASTRIENAILTDPEIYWIDTVLKEAGRPTSFQEKRDWIFDKLSKDRERSIEEVAGCRSMLSLIYENPKDFFPLTQTALRALHQELLKFYPPAHYYLGKYKTVPNHVIEKNSKTGAERTVFKTADPGPITEAAMHDLVQWYNETLREHPWTIAIASEFVFRFLAIHPFQDGNGRLGRGLFLLALLQSPDEDLAQLARYIAIDRQIERHKEEYYFVLQRCSGGVFHPDAREYQIEYFLKYMVKIMNLSFPDIEFNRKRYEAIQQFSESSRKVWKCFENSPEKRLQTQNVMEQTKLPRRTVIHCINLLLKNSLLQKYGQGASTRYQIIF